MTTDPIVVTIAYAAPRVEVLIDVRLAPATHVVDAVAQSGIVARLALDPAQLEFAIFGRRVQGDTPLRDGDRVELTRPLVADPKRIRRARAAKSDAAGSASPTGNKR
jgi:putative ubiquitin-RnfH superfamily antitoxin RatB of RatAB toxin-antitoxin module